MIEAHLKKSIGRGKALESGVAAEKGLGAEERQYSRRFWQYGEDPSCCRSNAESYLIFPTSVSIFRDADSWVVQSSAFRGAVLLFSYQNRIASLCFIQTQKKGKTS